MIAALPTPSASTFPVSARRSGGGQKPGPDDSDPGCGPYYGMEFVCSPGYPRQAGNTRFIAPPNAIDVSIY